MAPSLHLHSFSSALKAVLLCLLWSLTGGCEYFENPAETGDAGGEDRVEREAAPGEAMTLELRNGARLEVPAGAFDQSVRIRMESAPAEEGEESLGPTIRISIDPGSTRSRAPSRLELSQQSPPMRACIPLAPGRQGTSVSELDVLTRSGSTRSFMWVSQKQGDCLTVRLPPGLYEAEFEAILVDREGNECQSYGLAPDPMNSPTREKAIIFIHGWQFLRTTCQEYEAWSAAEVQDAWQPLLSGVRSCSNPDCARIRETFNVFYFKYPSSLVEPPVAAAHLRAEINRLLQDPTQAGSFSEIVLVGHSMGGLVGRYFNQVNRLSDIQKLLTLGTPHLGVYTNESMIGEVFQLGKYIARREFIGDPLPPTRGVRSLAYNSAFITALNSRDVQNRRDIYTFAGDISLEPAFSHGLYSLAYEYLNFVGEIIESQMGRDTLASERNDGVVTMKSALLSGSFSSGGNREGYDHDQMKRGRSGGTNDPLFVRVREVLSDFGSLAKSVRGRIVKGGGPMTGWKAVLVAEPDTAYFLHDLIEEAPITTSFTDSAGYFEFSGLETGQGFAVIVENPRLEASSRPTNEMTHVLIEDFDPGAGEELMFPTYDVRYQNPTANETVLHIDYSAPPNLTFGFAEHTGFSSPAYKIHVHQRNASRAFCWVSPFTFDTSIEWNMICNQETLRSKIAGPGPYYWYVVVRHPDHSRYQLSGFSFSGLFRLQSSSGDRVPTTSRDSSLGLASWSPAVVP